MKAKATHRNTFCKNCSSSNWADPGPGLFPPLGMAPLFPPLPRFMLVAKKPKGNAPIPKDIWGGFGAIS